MENYELYQKALRLAGYDHLETNVENLTECFLDYVSHGVWRDLDYDEAKDDIAEGEITPKMMALNLIRYCR